MKTEEKTRKKVGLLVLLSKTKGILDPKKIMLIAKKLTKRELRLYYQALVTQRSYEQVTVTSVMALTRDYKTRFVKAFPRKDVLFIEDPTILGGIKIAFGDFVFDATFLAYLTSFEKEYDENN